MSLHRWIVLAIGLVLVVVLYNLPMVVVDNDAADAKIDEKELVQEESHSFDFGKEAESQAESFLNSINTSSSNEKSVIFADSLAGLYLSYNKLDSAVKYIDMMLSLDGESLSVTERAGNMYFQVFSISLNQKFAREVALKSASCFEKVLETKEDPDISARLAMTMVTSQNPMQGIMMLRKVLEEYPENETALFNMGLLSMQSGQYDKAVERFKKLITVNSTHDQAAYYLAVSLFELGEKTQSKEWFQKIKTISRDPAILASADQYLSELKEL